MANTQLPEAYSTYLPTILALPLHNKKKQLTDTGKLQWRIICLAAYYDCDYYHLKIYDKRLKHMNY